MMTYDTTFQLGDFYVSSLLLRHTMLDGSPVMPLGFLIHERKFKETHEFFFLEVKKEVTYFSSEKNPAVPLVTDDEKALHEAAEEVLDNVSTLQCWNHLINSLKMWLRQHGANTQEIPVLLQQVWSLRYIMLYIYICMYYINVHRHLYFVINHIFNLLISLHYSKIYDINYRSETFFAKRLRMNTGNLSKNYMQFGVNQWLSTCKPN